jgi:hypothetical protein
MILIVFSAMFFFLQAIFGKNDINSMPLKPEIEYESKYGNIAPS